MKIREASISDLRDVLFVERAAFDREDEADLVRDLLADATARPLLSLLAYEGQQPLGHILFTRARLRDAPREVAVSLLAPLAVVPAAQGAGIGGALIARGLQLLTKSGVELVFVLGHPDYYPRHGFEPAGPLGLAAPYPIPAAHEDAWMVLALRPGVIGKLRGRVVCADALDKPEYWRE